MWRRRSVKLRARAEAGVGQALLAQAAKGVQVYIAALALVVGALVPGEAQPLKVVHEHLCGVAILGAGVKVFDSEDEPAAGGADGEPCHEGGEQVACVHPP